MVNEPGKELVVGLGANGDISDYWWIGAVGQPCLRASHIWLLLPGPPSSMISTTRTRGAETGEERCMYAIYSREYVLTLIGGQMRLQTCHLVEWLPRVLASHEIASLFPGALAHMDCISDGGWRSGRAAGETLCIIARLIGIETCSSQVRTGRGRTGSLTGELKWSDVWLWAGRRGIKRNENDAFWMLLFVCETSTFSCLRDRKQANSKLSIISHCVPSSSPFLGVLHIDTHLVKPFLSVPLRLLLGYRHRVRSSQICLRLD
jgi:hypothetical protein